MLWQSMINKEEEKEEKDQQTQTMTKLDNQQIMWSGCENY